MIYLRVTIVQIWLGHALCSLTFHVYACEHVPPHVEPLREVASLLIGYLDFQEIIKNNILLLIVKLANTYSSERNVFQAGVSRTFQVWHFGIKCDTCNVAFSFSSANSWIFWRELLWRSFAAWLFRTNFDDKNSSIEFGVLDFGFSTRIFGIIRVRECWCCRCDDLCCDCDDGIDGDWKYSRSYGIRFSRSVRRSSISTHSFGLFSFSEHFDDMLNNSFGHDFDRRIFFFDLADISSPHVGLLLSGFRPFVVVLCFGGLFKFSVLCEAFSSWIIDASKWLKMCSCGWINSWKWTGWQWWWNWCE